MHFCYILYSKKIDKYYIGQTSNIHGRIARHNSSKKGFTSTGKPWVLVYSEKFHDKSSALKREKQLKRWKSRKDIERLIQKGSEHPGETGRVWVLPRTRDHRPQKTTYHTDRWFFVYLNMYFSYILYSQKIDKYYIGQTSNIDARIARHNSSKKGFTSTGKPWALVYSEKFHDKSSALKREKQLKRWKSRKDIERLIQKGSEHPGETGRAGGSPEDSGSPPTENHLSY